MPSRSLDHLAEPVRLAALSFLNNAKRSGLEVLIHCTLRTNEEQAREYAYGRTKAGAVRTNCAAGMSLHNPDKNGKAWAFDAVPMLGGVCQWNNYALLEKMGRFGETAGLEWSGRWTGKLTETGHFQMNKNKQAQGFIDPDTMANAMASVEPVTMRDRVIPALKSKKAAAVVGIVLMALPTISIFVPQISPFIGAINAFAQLFGYGV